ncbi:alpha/beta hydrolase family protein [Sphingobacterium paucimobilis]|uniref:Peptidase S9 prolyl oligopeptidase catalytic domain-containing protein n=1 Tax=Sphingobacterium paucimobilis HER1398 TaxID=1346330 RepID=U2J300_9SPHI|nr:prolyl oligopeptidase family serine peptidase [Sphingobacterium paucimobilis]ERJ59344.1 hypothetical protein M472_11225 [Sphingobacterium paucimobilis HER1398]
MKVILFNIVSLLCLISCPVSGQVAQERNELLVNDLLSADGKVIAYYIVKQNKSREYTIRDSHRNKDYLLENIENTQLNNRCFLGEDKRKKHLYFIDFKRTMVDTVKNVRKFTFVSESELLVFETTENEVFIRNPYTRKQINMFRNIIDYEFSEDNEILLLKGKTKDIILDFKSASKSEIVLNDRGNCRFKKVVGSRSEAFYVLGNTADSLFLYKKEEDRLREVFKHSLVLDEGNRIDTLFNHTALLNENNLVFAALAGGISNSSSDRAEIWRGGDNGISPRLTEKVNKAKQLVLVDIKNLKLYNFFTAGKLINYSVNYKQQTIYEYEANEHDDYSKQFPDVTLYQRSRKYNWEKKKIGRLNGSPNSILTFNASPFLFYFLDKDWYFYEGTVKKDITGSAQAAFYNAEYVSLRNDAFIKRPVLYNKQKLLLEAVNDVYLYDLKINKGSIFAAGSINDRNYDIVPDNINAVNKPWMFSSDWEINGKTVLLKWNNSNYSREGLSVVGENNKLKDIVKVDGKISQVKISDNIITYVVESYNQPPALYKVDRSGKRKGLLYQSNSWDTDISVKIEVVQWVNSKGEKRKALVRSVVDLIPGKKYPAIVSVYEKKIPEYHTYISPDNVISSGINYRNYINDGYIVIEPDIHYDESGPGVSAVKSVEEALELVEGLYPVDKENIGMIGHSFGGYETNFIISQTNRFKTAVSSAGVSDLNSFFLTVNWNTMVPDMWRMETQQWRMGTDLFSGYDKYRKNSPVNYAENVNTPLLLIAGKSDYKINWNQSVMYFMALKKAGKQVNMLLYPGEDHELLNAENKKDASDKIKSWFEYYLKNGNKPDWL